MPTVQYHAWWFINISSSSLPHSFIRPLVHKYGVKIKEVKKKIHVSDKRRHLWICTPHNNLSHIVQGTDEFFVHGVGFRSFWGIQIAPNPSQNRSPGINLYDCTTYFIGDGRRIPWLPERAGGRRLSINQFERRRRRPAGDRQSSENAGKMSREK